MNTPQPPKKKTKNTRKTNIPKTRFSVISQLSVKTFCFLGGGSQEDARAQMQVGKSAKERRRRFAKEHERARKSTKERFSASIRQPAVVEPEHLDLVGFGVAGDLRGDGRA